MGKPQHYQNYCNCLGINSLVILTAHLFTHKRERINAFPRCIFLQDVQKEILYLLFKTVVMVVYLKKEPK